MSGAKKADLMAAEAVLKTLRDQLDYRHSDEAFIAPGLTALDVYRAMTSSNPLYLRVAFRIRDMLCRPVGIAPIGGFSAGNLPGTVTAGDRLDFFDVHSATDDELVLFSDDRHLTVVVTLRLTRESLARQRLSIVTSVKVKEMLGRLYPSLFTEPAPLVGSGGFQGWFGSLWRFLTVSRDGCGVTATTNWGFRRAPLSLGHLVRMMSARPWTLWLSGLARFPVATGRRSVAPSASATALTRTVPPMRTRPASFAAPRSSAGLRLAGPSRAGGAGSSRCRSPWPLRGGRYAEEALRQIAQLYVIEASVRGQTPAIRMAARTELSAPIVTAFRPWLEAQLSRIPRSSKLSEDIRSTLGLWPGLIRFLDDGRLEMDTNPVENQIRRVALTRKNALFAGHEVGAENWAMLASLVATCKMSDVNPVSYIAETLRAILDGHTASRIENLMPWHFRKTSSRAA
ncbi:DUF2867 domain-containing protein [Cereibacter johrii]|uniref:DUF2867 domain-containing protein n=1 Tax=Cereibacter johrii TaxID=445629 RepID=UPI000DCEB76A|nr:DUF2867 domain-containing protein [Cereibacter johrii]RAZ82093.1 hypothetical protein DDV93_20825 [Cereibacter johrii]